MSRCHITIEGFGLFLSPLSHSPSWMIIQKAVSLWFSGTCRTCSLSPCISHSLKSHFFLFFARVFDPLISWTVSETSKRIGKEFLTLWISLRFQLPSHIARKYNPLSHWYPLSSSLFHADDYHQMYLFVLLQRFTFCQIGVKRCADLP